MDTKPLEIEAESRIKSELLKYNFKTIKPDFDENGADLLIIDNIETKYSHIVKVQCKGRNIEKNGSNITIPSNYVTDNFIVFLYVKLEGFKTKLLVFFPEDIMDWKRVSKKYILNFNSNSIQDEPLKNKEFSDSSYMRINELLIDSKIKKYTSVIIDSIFLNKAIKKTIIVYKEIYPEKQFNKPKLKDVAEYILSYYDRFQGIEKDINISYVFNREVLQPTETIENNPKSFYVNGETLCRLQIEEIDQFVNFEILKKMERIINNENIILVADDILYEDPLNEFMNKGVEVTLVQFKSNYGRQMYTDHYWGDIMSPIGRALGLSEYEL